MFQLPPDCVEPIFSTVLGYWESKRRDGKLPTRREIDPLDLGGTILPYILLFEVVPAEAPTTTGLRFRFRLAGTAFRQIAGRDVTGLCFDELGPAERTAPVIRQLTMTVEHLRPAYLVGRVTARSDAHEDIGRLALPLSSDGAGVDKILGVWFTMPLAANAAISPFEGVPRLLEGS